jgi:hypothetical protein
MCQATIANKFYVTRKYATQVLASVQSLVGVLGLKWEELLPDDSPEFRIEN